MISTLISFGGYYYKYHGIKNEEKGLTIGGYEYAFLVKLVTPYMFEKSKTLLNRTTYHGIYLDDDMVVFKVNNSIQ